MRVEAYRGLQVLIPWVGSPHVRILAHLAGDVSEMAAAELRAVLAAHGAPLTTLRETPRFLDGHAELFFDEAEAVCRRLGLSHVVAMHLFDGEPGSWPPDAGACCFPTGIPFAVRYIRIDPEAPWSSAEVEREVGAVLAPGRPINLKQPALLARAFLLQDRVYVGQQLWESDPKALQERHVENRPYFSPVSLEPRLARALVNLSQAKPGDRLYDPFCGTGGILLEAATMGIRVVGSDLDAEMVAGSRTNLAHYGLDATLFESDVGDAPGHLKEKGLAPVDVVVSDLPYGRSASTGKEATRDLYRRGFEAVREVLRPGGHAVLGVPDEASARDAEGYLEPVALYKVRRHKSLTRHFALLRRR